MPKETKSLRRSDQYDDPTHNYLDYWSGRDYEHRAEVLAIKRLLRGKHFHNAVDVGGGYGRLSTTLLEFADQVTLAEPSKQQLNLAKDFLKNHPEINQQLMQADNLNFPEGAIDLLIMIRVLHHLPDPGPELREVARVLSKDGYAIIEMANYAHARNRLKLFIKGQRLPKKPIDISSVKHRQENDIPFVNHNPYEMAKQLKSAGLAIDRILSVSNLRSPILKKIVPTDVLIAIEGILQPTLASSFFGPSIFFLVRKLD